MSEERELPGMPESKAPRKGTHAHTWYEWKRYRHLSKTHGGLTTAAWASRILGVSTQRVYQLMDAGHLPNEEVLGKRWIRCDALESFAEMERDAATRYPAAMAA